jgi:hypothetical protein
VRVLLDCETQPLLMPPGSGYSHYIHGRHAITHTLLLQTSLFTCLDAKDSDDNSGNECMCLCHCKLHRNAAIHVRHDGIALRSNALCINGRETLHCSILSPIGPKLSGCRPVVSDHTMQNATKLSPGPGRDSKYDASDRANVPLACVVQ